MVSFRVLVTGATGFLGRHVVAALRERGVTVVGLGRQGGDLAADLSQRAELLRVLHAVEPDAVLHLAAMSRIDDCTADPAAARAVNAAPAGQFAVELGPRLLYVSTDLVFDGRSPPYREHDAVAPLSVYGASKAEGEELALAQGGRVVRLPLLFGADDRGRGATAALLEAQRAQRSVSMFTNEYRTPMHAADAARLLCELLPDFAAGARYHLAGPERVSRWQLARRFAAVAGLSLPIEPVECNDPTRPRDVSLLPSLGCPRSLDAMLAAAISP